MLISEQVDKARRCREDFLAAKRGLQDAVRSINAHMTQMGSAIAVAEVLPAFDKAELAEWQTMQAEAQAALREHGETIKALMGE